ncbi:MAG TPA: penicillin-binding protein [Anaeromyxobacter sp.]|nr:penicillin-binding protein [Anaeromyxobacter sp.]
MRPAGQAWTPRWVGVRIGLLGALLAAGFGAVAVRAFHLQVVREDLESGPWLSELKLRPRRGDITDRNGNPLAASADAQSVYADPELLFSGGKKREVLAADSKLAAQLRRQGEARLRQAARLLKVDPEPLVKRAARGGRFLWIARRVLPDREKALRAWLAKERPAGIALLAEPRRYYPKLELASTVLGMVGDDGAGIEGIELSQEERLQGFGAEVRAIRDGAGNLVFEEPPVSGKERQGDHVVLTLDQGIQATAERALSRAVASSRALSGMAVVLDPSTGEVLAMASWPVPNPNARRTAEQLRNRPVADAFEPGSTVKAFSIAAALDAGVFRPLDAVDCGNGKMQIGAHVIRDHAGLGWAGGSRIVAQSSNVGTARIGARLGRERLRAALGAFGFGEKTGIELPGESRGQLVSAGSAVGVATQSFGQGPITATALQVTNAMATIANGGVRLRPRIVRQIVDAATGEVIERSAPEVVGRAVSAETAALMTRWLVGVIEDPKGTGRRAALDGWRAAGKTGTAQKVDRVSGGYSNDRHFSSFVGFAPVEAPRVVIGVFLDEPRGEYYGGEVAAPVFKEIAEYALRVLDVRPQPLAAQGPAPVPAPEPARLEEAPGPPAVEWSGAAVGTGRVAVPSLAGLPARAAIRALETVGLGAELRGTGRVVEQSPPPGRAVERGTRVRMRLVPAS